MWVSGNVCWYVWMFGNNYWCVWMFGNVCWYFLNVWKCLLVDIAVSLVLNWLTLCNFLNCTFIYLIAAGTL